jgi:hypothetical protein
LFKDSKCNSPRPIGQHFFPDLHRTLLKIGGIHLPLFKEFHPNLGNVSSKTKKGIEIQKRRAHSSKAGGVWRLRSS